MVKLEKSKKHQPRRCLVILPYITIKWGKSIDGKQNLGWLPADITTIWSDFFPRLTQNTSYRGDSGQEEHGKSHFYAPRCRFFPKFNFNITKSSNQLRVSGEFGLLLWVIWNVPKKCWKWSDTSPGLFKELILKGKSLTAWQPLISSPW